MGDNSVTVAGAGDAGCSEHGRAGDDVARVVGKGAVAGEAT